MKRATPVIQCYWWSSRQQASLGSARHLWGPMHCKHAQYAQAYLCGILLPVKWQHWLHLSHAFLRWPHWFGISSCMCIEIDLAWTWSLVYSVEMMGRECQSFMMVRSGLTEKWTETTGCSGTLWIRVSVTHAQIQAYDHRLLKRNSH